MKRKQSGRAVPERPVRTAPQRRSAAAPPVPANRNADRLARIERRKARQRAFSLTILVLLIMVATVYAIIWVMREARPRPRFIFIQEGTVTHQVTLTGLIVRDDQLFTAPSDGILKPLAAEGSRVARGQKLALVIPEGREAELDELQKCEKDIIDLQNELMQQGKGAAARAIYDESEASLAAVINLIRADLTRQDLGNISTYQTALNLILEQRTARLMPVDFQDARLADLKLTRTALEQSLGLAAATLTCQKPGIVSYRLDGLEGDLSNKSILSMPAERIQEQIGASTDSLPVSETVTKDAAVLRVASGLYQSLAFMVPGNQTALFPVDSTHTLTLTDEGLPMAGCQAVRVEKSAGDTLVVFRTDRRIEWLSDRRVVRATLPLTQTTGLKVPVSSLLDYDADNGTAILMIVVNGVARHCPVAVVDQDGQSAIVAGVADADYPISVATILVVNPDSIQEGEFIGE
ncbi:MAG: hypothetical protein GX112_05460 [Clostridiaceae bacterium]|jgi:multidrug efflux pump subunit AcrA (membrane-fusion protein)|nr:hypothetical protein [Clostridiaceae bacterium]